MPLNTAIAITIGGINVYEEPLQEKYGRDGNEAARIIVVNGTNRIALINYMLGGVNIVGGIPTYNFPQQFPDAPWLWCWAAETQNLIGPYNANGNSGMISSNEFRIKFTFKPTQYNGNTELGNENLDVSSQFITFPDGSLVFDTGQKIVGAACPGIRMVTATYTRTIRSLPQLPSSTLFSLAGCVNDSVFLGANVGTLLYTGFTSQRRFIVGGATNWDVTHKLSWRQFPWNQAYNPDPAIAAWQHFAYAGGGGDVYPAGDFTQLGFST